MNVKAVHMNWARLINPKNLGREIGKQFKIKILIGGKASRKRTEMTHAL